MIGAAHAGWKGALGGVLEARGRGDGRAGRRAGADHGRAGPLHRASLLRGRPRVRGTLHRAERRQCRILHAQSATGRGSTSRAISRSGCALAGVGRVDVMPHDTCADDERFFSYRRTTLRREEQFRPAALRDRPGGLAGGRGGEHGAASRKPRSPDSRRERPLELDSDRAVRAERKPYGIIDIGSNSVRLVVYDELGRAPLPRFNEKSMCRLGEGLAETGAIAEENFRRTVEAVRRFRAIADAMGVSPPRRHRDRGGPARQQRPGSGRRHRPRRPGSQVRVLSGAEEAHFAAQGVISGLFRPVGLVGDMGGGSLEVAEALDDRVGERWVSLPLGALPVQSLLEAVGPAAKEPDRRAAARGPAAGADRARVLRRRRRLSGAGQGAPGGRRRAGAGGARLHRAGRQDAGVRQEALALLAPDKLGGMPGVASRRVRDAAGRRHRAGPGDQASRAGAGGVLRPGPARGLALRPVARGRALSRSPGRGCAAVRAAARARAGLRTGTGALDRRAVPGRGAGRPPPAAGRVRAVRHRLARPPGRAGGGELPPPAAVPVHRRRPCRARLHRAGDPRPLRRRAPTPAGWSQRSRCSRPACAAGR